MKGKVSIPGDATAHTTVKVFGPFPSPACLPSLQMLQGHTALVCSLHLKPHACDGQKMWMLTHLQGE